MKVDNFEKIYPLLNFDKKGDFYWITLLLRKKDATTTFGNKNDSARIVKDYHIYSLDYLKKKEEEIKALCDMFKCRAGIYLNQRNDEEVAHMMNKRLAEMLYSKNYKATGLLNSVLGEIKGDSDKYWLIDCDSKEEYEKCKSAINHENMRPIGNLIYAEIPTRNGIHLITKRFDTKFFSDLTGYNSKEFIQKNNPTALYYPEL